jgi:hypothetical protein
VQVALAMGKGCGQFPGASDALMVMRSIFSDAFALLHSTQSNCIHSELRPVRRQQLGLAASRQGGDVVATASVVLTRGVAWVAKHRAKAL